MILVTIVYFKFYRNIIFIYFNCLHLIDDYSTLKLYIQCCRKTDKAGPFTLYNAFNKACCANGHVVTDSSQC